MYIYIIIYILVSAPSVGLNVCTSGDTRYSQGSDRVTLYVLH